MHTTVAPQALALLNDPFVRRRAEEFAARLGAGAGGDTDAQIRRAFQFCFNRAPAHDELADARNFINSRAEARRQRDAKQPAATARRLAFADFCQSLFGLNEFIYVD